MKSRHSTLVPSFFVAEEPKREEQELSIDIRAVLAKLWSGRLVLLSSAVFSTLIGLYAASQMEPRYRATAKVMFDPQLRELAAVGQLPSLGAGEDGMQNEIQILRSSTLVNKVVEDLQLSRFQEFNPFLLDAEQSFLWPVFGKLNPTRGTAEGSDASTPDLERRVVAENVLAGLRLEPVQSSRVIEISFISSDPSIAADVANAFAEQYIQDQLDVRISTTRAAADLISGSVDELQTRLQDAEAAVEAARSAQSVQAGQSIEITERQLEALVNTHSATGNAARTARATHERLNNALQNKVDLASVPEFRDSALMTGLMGEEADLRLQRANLVEILSLDHPSIAEVDAKLAHLAELQMAEAKRITSVARTRWESLDEQTSSIQLEISQRDLDVRRQSADQLAIRQLEREADASRRLYEMFLTRMNEASEQVKLESADARILSVAESPLHTYSQSRQRAVLIALIAGILAGMVLVFLRDRLDNTLRSVDQLRRVTGMDVLGTTPSLKGVKSSADVFRKVAVRPNSHFAEAIRGLRTSILSSHGEKPPKVIMFTSSLPGEGKSLLAALMALSSYRMNKKTIIVDCDFRRPKIGQMVGEHGNENDILSVLDGSAALETAIMKEPASGLHVLSANTGQFHTHSSAVDLMSSPKFAQLIGSLRKTYDLIILNAPPALFAADAKIISAHADAIAYVVRWKQTPCDAVLEGLRELKSVNAPVSGVVLSMVDAHKASSFPVDDPAFAN